MKMMEDVTSVIKLQKIVTPVLLADYMTFPGLHILIRQAATLARLRWQETRETVALTLAAMRNYILPTTTGV